MITYWSFFILILSKVSHKSIAKLNLMCMIMAIAMVAMLAFGGTYAYFTADAATISGTDAKTGKIELTNGSAAITTSFDGSAAGKFAVPGDTLWAVNVTPVNGDTNVKTYVFATWGVEDTDAVLEVASKLDGDDEDELPDGVDGWFPLDGEDGVYYTIVDAGEEIPAFKDSVVFATSNKNNMMNLTIKCSIQFRSIQYDYAGTPAEAYTKLGSGNVA